MTHNPRKKKLSVTLEDFRKIMGEDWKLFQEKIIHNVWCHNCDNAYHATIIDYTVEINDLNDSILHGKCEACGNPVNRYLETGENPQQFERIEEIRKRR